MSADIPTQPRNLPLHVSKEKCSGGTYIVTGANTGLGFEAAKHLVQVDAAKVILAVRNVTAGDAAKAKIVEATGKEGVAEVWVLDLASYDSVKAFAKRATEELNRIDAVIENAAVAMSQRTLAEGHVMPVTVNVFSTFLLAVLLLPKLSESAKKFGILPHIAMVTSRAGFDFHEDWEKIKDDPVVGMDNDDMVTMKTYPLTKLLETMAGRHLATVVPVSRTGVVINLICPGLCKTELSRNAPPEFRESLAKQHEQFGRTAEDGSRTLLHGAVAGKESHGCLLDSCELGEHKVPEWAAGDEGKRSQKRAWEVVAKELETIEPGCVTRILE
ncbi:Fc.00g104360.m01.CDS01 [Cosmosporella sp. VM-42]